MGARRSGLDPGLKGDLVRPARLGDAAAIARILRDKGLCEPSEAVKARVRAGLMFSLADPHHTVFVAENAKGRAAAFISVAWTSSLGADLEGYVMEVSAHSRFRGLESCLLEAVRGEAARRGCQRLVVLKRREGEPYQDFFVRHGWQERQDLIILELSLRP
jgi:GNAT superfamily N-acetyltransferase